MWVSLVCTLIHKDMRDHSGQNLLWTHSAAPLHKLFPARSLFFKLLACVTQRYACSQANVAYACNTESECIQSPIVYFLSQFMKVDGKVQLPDSLENAKFTSMAWTHDNKGLFYNVSSFFLYYYKLAIH